MTRNGTILLVEDNQDDVELTLTAFENHHVASNIVVAWVITLPATALVGALCYLLTGSLL